MTTLSGVDTGDSQLSQLRVHKTDGLRTTIRQRDLPTRCHRLYSMNTNQRPPADRRVGRTNAVIQGELEMPTLHLRLPTMTY